MDLLPCIRYRSDVERILYPNIGTKFSVKNKFSVFQRAKIIDFVMSIASNSDNFSLLSEIVTNYFDRLAFSNPLSMRMMSVTIGACILIAWYYLEL